METQHQQEVIVGKVCEIYEKISNLGDLNPSNHVNNLFTQLVTICTTPCQLDVTRLSKQVRETIANLIRLCGKAEGLLENHYSTLIGSPKVINHLAKFMAPGAFLVLRSAHGARAFLYPVVDPCSDLKGFEVLSVFHPTDEVINSVIVARKHSVNQGVYTPVLASKCSGVEGFNPFNHGNVIEELTVDEQA
uniref:Nicotianamine synthase n=1 Tax=Cajanus cajan TaxID=3821 RepID=A0A151R2F8_CAJCA|nr:Nicotianamine synthase [Cajanus cajan]